MRDSGSLVVTKIRLRAASRPVSAKALCRKVMSGRAGRIRTGDLLVPNLGFPRRRDYRGSEENERETAVSRTLASLTLAHKGSQSTRVGNGQRAHAKSS